ncbi:MAG: hypothetical protein AAGC70_10310 [Pseudomonadota bacterium]
MTGKVIRRSTGVVWLVALYALATLVAPWLHRSAANASPPVDLSAYALPDGTLPVLCIGGNAASDTPHFDTAICDACLLSAAPGLPASNAVAIAAPSDAGQRLSATSRSQLVARHYLGCAWPRGPPARG